MAACVYDDFLSLLEKRFNNARYVLFCGRSGSGKSTAVRLLLEGHPDFAHVTPFVIRPQQCEWQKIPDSASWIVVDEVKTIGDIFKIAKILAQGKRVLAASHVPPFLFRPLRIFGPGMAFLVDRDPAKLASYLQRKGIAYTDEALQRFVTRYGATYTDMEIILEYAGESNFDKAFARFERFCSIRLNAEN